MKFLKSFINVPKKLLYSVIFSFLGYVLINYYFIKFEEWLVFGSELGEIFSKIFLTIISSYIFFSIVHQYKADIDKDRTKSFIAKKLEVIFQYSNYIYAGLDLNMYPVNHVQLTKALTGITSTDLADKVKIGYYVNGQLLPYDWHLLLILIKSKTESSIEDLNKFSSLSSEFQMLLNEIKCSDLFEMIDIFEKTKINIVAYNLSDFNNHFASYLNSCNKLLKWAIKNDYSDDIPDDIRKKILNDEQIVF